MRIKSIIYSIPVFFLLSACNDEFLERYPLAELAPENSFKSEIELQAYTNAFYNQLPTALDIFYNAPVFADDDARVTVPDEIRGSRTVPTTGGGWSWSALRRINFFLENSHNFPNEEIRVKYDGLARFFRAYFYYDKIQRFGDVPWYDRVLATDDEAELMKARDPRSFVVERMLEDLDYAIAHLDNERHAQRITKWTALAFKSRVCLFEGTFRKYHGLPGWEDI